MLRTYSEWEKSGKQLVNFLKEGDVITTEWAKQLRDSVEPEYKGKGIFQYGDHQHFDQQTQRLLYLTFTQSQDKLSFRYIGLLPSVNVEPLQCSACGYNFITCDCKSLHF